MSIQIIPKEINGSISVPGSKSISNRILAMAALSNSNIRIEGLLISDDTKVMMNALSSIGVDIQINNNDVLIKGLSGKFNENENEIYLENSGTSTRILTALLSLVPGVKIIDGNDRMKERPMKDLIDSLRDNAIDIKCLNNEGFLPIQINSSRFPGGDIFIKGNVSSQFISSILITAPYAKKEIILNLSGEIISKSYIEMTLKLMKKFGIEVNRISENTFKIPLGIYTLNSSFKVEADASSSVYPLAMAAISGGKVTVNIGSKSIQGDSKFYTILEKMGCIVSQTELSTTVIGPKKLKAIEIDMNDMTDSFMVVSILASVAEGKSKIYNIKNQRLKECDRIKAISNELKKSAINVKELDDGLEIIGGNPHGALIKSYDDHRIAMSFAVLGTKIAGIIISDPDCTKKTYPNFWKDIEKAFNVKYL